MIKIPIDQLRPGMRLARSILTGEGGNVLLGAGTRLKPSFIRRLKEIGYTAVYIAEPGLEDVIPPELVRQETRVEAVRALEKVFAGAKGRGTIDERAVATAVRGIVDDVLGNKDVLIHLGDVRGHDDYTFAHSVSVGALCALIGRGLGYVRSQLYELATGGLLHDVGKIFIPQEVLNKKGPLTPAELELIREHPRDGFELLRSRYSISLRAAHMAYQHHELLDGSGYPRGLKGDKIHPYARINAVADAFDAMTADRPYRAAMAPLKAISILQDMAGTLYDAKVVAVLRSFIAPYPVGTKVRLNTGELAVVVNVRRSSLERPRVRIIEAGGKPLAPPYPEVELRDRPDLSITGVEEDGGQRPRPMGGS